MAKTNTKNLSATIQAINSWKNDGSWFPQSARTPIRTKCGRTLVPVFQVRSGEEGYRDALTGLILPIGLVGQWLRRK